MKILRGGARSLAELAKTLPVAEIALGRTVLSLRDRGLLLGDPAPPRRRTGAAPAAADVEPARPRSPLARRFADRYAATLPTVALGDASRRTGRASDERLVHSKPTFR